MKCTYLINMEDGRLEFRDEYTETQVNLKPIPDEVKSMIMRGEVTARDVINAISMKVKESGEFNLTEYLEGMKRLNVRQSNKQEAPKQVELADVEDAISVEDVKIAKSKSGDSTTKTAKKERAKKVNDVLDNVEIPEMFKAN